MNILITICARGGSKGIPGKNIRPLNGKSLIGYTIDTANRFCQKYNCDIALSTDDALIKQAALTFGLDTNYYRPDALATDGAGKIDTIVDILQYEENLRAKKYDYVLDLDVTSPLRTVEDLELAFELIKNDANAYNLFSVNQANRNPYFNMVEQQPNGYFGLVKKAQFHTRQSAPAVYDVNASFYFYKRTFFEEKHKSAVTDRTMIYVMPHLCFDLDHPIDFDFMEYLLTSNKLGFDL